LDLQQFQIEYETVINHFLLGISHFDEENDMLIIEYLCSNMEKKIFF